MACVTLKPGQTLSADELIAHCRRSLANYKIPRRVEFLETELPKNGSGKILKRVLRERFEVHQERSVAISEGLRRENDNIRVTVISPGLTKSELDDTISDLALAEGMREFRRIAIGADAIARAIAFAVEQPADVNVSEIIVQPTASPY